jgi:hypothetical protein
MRIALPARAASALFTLLFLLPTPALAVSGLYGQVGLGYGKLGGSNLYTNKMDMDLPVTGDNCCPSAGPVTSLRLGYSLFGFGGAEFGMIGHGWDLGSSTGGAGFVGGGLRAFPLAFISLLGLDTSDFPIDIGIGGLFGWTILGKDFAYTGRFLDFDITVEYKFTEWMSAGVKVDLVLPTYSDFVYTSYSNNEGRCLDSGGDQVASQMPGGPMIPVSAQNSDVVKKGSVSCSGRGPSTNLVAPQVVFTFHFDVFE